MTTNNNRVRNDAPKPDKNNGDGVVVESLQVYPPDGGEELVLFERYRDDEIEKEHGSNQRWMQSDLVVEVDQ
jgi:hypothetical protein